MAKDFVPFANNLDTNPSFKGDYNQMRANVPNKSPGLRGYPMQDNDPYSMQDQGYMQREYYPGHNEQLGSRYRGEFANQQPVLRAGNLSSPGHRNEFNMNPGQRRMEFRREYNCPPHYVMPHTEGMYPGPSGMDYSKMPYLMKSPGMGSESASLPDMRSEPVSQAFNDKMKKNGGFGRGVPSNGPFNNPMQQPDPHVVRNREGGLGMSREEPGNLDACQSKQYVRNESEMNQSVHSSMNMMYKDGKSVKNGPLLPVEYGYHMSSYPSTSSANKSFVGNINPSVMESEINKAHGLDPGTDRKFSGNFDAYQRSMFSKSEDPTDSKPDVSQKTEDKKREMMFSTSGKEFLKGKQAGPCDDALANSGGQDFTKGYHTAPADEGLVNSKRQRPAAPKSPAQSSNASEIDSFLESDAKLPFEPLRDSLDSDTEIPASLQSFLKSNNLVLKEIQDEYAWNQLFSEAYRRMERATATTDRHSEIRNLMCKQKEFLNYPFLSEHDIKEYSEYLAKGREKVEYTQLIDKAIQAFAEKRKYNLDFIFNDNEEDEKLNK